MPNLNVLNLNEHDVSVHVVKVCFMLHGLE